MDELRELRETAARNGISLESSSYDADPRTPDEIRVQWMNDEPGKLKGYDCPDCKNRGKTYCLKDGYVVASDCQCLEIRRSLARLENSGLGDLLERYTFESYKTMEPWQQHARGLALKFAHEPGGHWFAAMGVVGAGKTHLCTAICGFLLKKGVDVRYMLWKDDGRAIKAVTNEGEEYDRLMRPLQTVKALYIDDFFKTKKDEITGKYEQPSPADIDLAFKIINARYNNVGLITIISSERTGNEIINIDEAVGSRIYERSKGFSLKLSGEDKNWRLK